MIERDGEIVTYEMHEYEFIVTKNKIMNKRLLIDDSIKPKSMKLDKKLQKNSYHQFLIALDSFDFNEQDFEFMSQISIPLNLAGISTSYLENIFEYRFSQKDQFKDFESFYATELDKYIEMIEQENDLELLWLYRFHYGLNIKFRVNTEYKLVNVKIVKK